MRGVYLWAYSNASRSSAALAEALGIRRLRHSNSTARPRVVINWGRGIDHDRVVNEPSAVACAINKLSAFQHCAAYGVSIPEWTTSKEAANSWLGSTKVVCRATLTGHEGQGITIHEQGPLPDVPLYVKYIPKKKEFRVHVCNNKVFDVQQKVRRSTYDGAAGFEIRNTANGFIFQRNGIIVSDGVKQEAVKAVEALLLDFGAVDVIWNESQDKAYALEVNTAPGLEGSSVANYARVIRELIQERFGSSG